MSEDKKVPEIRFAGFTDAWEQRKLEELGTITTGNTPSTAVPEYYSDDGIVWVTPTDIIENITVDSAKKLSKQGQQVGRIVPKNTILVTCIASIGKNTMLGNTGSFNQQINGLTPDENKYDPYFLLTESALWSAKMKSSAAAGTMQIVNRTEFSELKTWLPSLIEQKAIGDFFSRLDNLITLHQRKHDKLVVLKQAMLEKMFPQGGSNVPEVRFTGFTDPWEQRKFGDDLISIQTGTNKLGSENGKGTPLLKMGNIQRGYFSLDKIEYLSDGDDVEPENIAYYGDFFFNTRNTLELVGKGATWTGNSGEYAFNSNIARFKLRELDTIFFNYLYNTRSMIEQVHARAMGTTSVAAIYPQSLKSIEYYVPTMAEQQRIGELLLKIDNLITLHHRKHESLKHIKAALLQKMFV